MEVFVDLNQGLFGYAMVEQNPDGMGPGRAQQGARELVSESAD